MFFHNFKYSLKILIHNKILIFWTFVFPILLGLFFHMAFSNIEKEEQLDTIPIAIVEQEDSKLLNGLEQILESLTDKNTKKRLFQITKMDETSAKKMLEEDKIIGYLYHDSKVHIMVKQNGVEETILRYTVDSVISDQKLASNLIEKEMQNSKGIVDYKKISKKVSKMLEEDVKVIKDTSSKNLSYTMIEYYTLIAMACLYGGVLSMFVMNQKLPNMSHVGKRSFIAPITKKNMILGSLFASYLVQLIGLMILFLFTIFILKVDYGSNLFLVILLACCGSFAGLSLGVLVATQTKSNENTKIGILIAITMLGCFLSGMMGITMKYVIDKNIPLFNKINPASMITDGFYSLYYYNTHHRFLLGLVSLLLFSAILIGISIYGLRRKKYDYI